MFGEDHENPLRRPAYIQENSEMLCFNTSSFSRCKWETLTRYFRCWKWFCSAQVEAHQLFTPPPCIEWSQNLAWALEVSILWLDWLKQQGVVISILPKPCSGELNLTGFKQTLITSWTGCDGAHHIDPQTIKLLFSSSFIPQKAAKLCVGDLTVLWLTVQLQTVQK